jgi:hypothetical protein
MKLLPDVTTYSNTRENWYYEKLVGSKQLTITAGDSWTWGDNLGKMNSRDGVMVGDDFEFRTTHTYGQVLANMLASDFLNVARPGAWNIEIHDRLKYALKHIAKTYEKVRVIITLTELGREFWSDPLWLPDNLADYTDVDELLSAYESNMFRSFELLCNEYPDIDFFIARNFTYTYQENNIPQCVDKTWVDILQEHQSLPFKYPDDVRFVTSLVVTQLHKRLKHDGAYKQLKYQFMEQYASGLLASEWLVASKFNNSISSKHPTEAGHQLWAEYLYSVINSNEFKGSEG